jgi:hypothetical protein
LLSNITRFVVSEFLPEQYSVTPFHTRAGNTENMNENAETEIMVLFMWDDEGVRTFIL